MMAGRKRRRSGYKGTIGGVKRVVAGEKDKDKEGRMKLTVQHVDGMRFLATAEGHTVIVDAALEDGGGGTAVSAPQLFVAAMGVYILEFVTNSCRMRTR